MNRIYYTVHSQKIVFRNYESLHKYIINAVAKDCRGEKMLNRAMSEYFKKEVEASDCPDVLKLFYNNGYEVID